MKTTRIILAAAFVGTLGLSGLARTVYARQSSPGVIQHQSSNQIAQSSYGNGGQNNATEAPGQVKQPSSIPIKVQEASDGDGEQNDATEAPEQVKQNNSHAVANSASNTQEDVNDGPNDADSTHKDAQ